MSFDSDDDEDKDEGRAVRGRRRRVRDRGDTLSAGRAPRRRVRRVRQTVRRAHLSPARAAPPRREVPAVGLREGVARGRGDG